MRNSILVKHRSYISELCIIYISRWTLTDWYNSKTIKQEHRLAHLVGALMIVPPHCNRSQKYESYWYNHCSWLCASSYCRFLPQFWVSHNKMWRYEKCSSFVYLPYPLTHKNVRGVNDTSNTKNKVELLMPPIFGASVSRSQSCYFLRIVVILVLIFDVLREETEATINCDYLKYYPQTGFKVCDCYWNKKLLFFIIYTLSLK